jgi:hypothetical protein
MRCSFSIRAKRTWPSPPGPPPRARWPPRLDLPADPGQPLAEGVAPGRVDGLGPLGAAGPAGCRLGSGSFMGRVEP